MRIASYILGFYLLLLTTSTGWAQPLQGRGNQGQQKSSPAATPLEDFERRGGPLKIKHQNFTVVLHLKRVRDPGAHAVRSEETVSQMEILGDAGSRRPKKS